MKKKQISSTNSNTDCRAKIKKTLRRQQRQLLVKLNQNTPKKKKQEDQILPPHPRYLQVVIMLPRLCGTV